MLFNRLKKHIVEIPAYNEQNLHVTHGQNAYPSLVKVLKIRPGFKELQMPSDVEVVGGPTTSGVNLQFKLTRPSQVKVEFWFEDTILKDGPDEFVIRPNVQKDGVVLQQIQPGGIGQPPA